jgi:hypothetical protein
VPNVPVARPANDDIDWDDEDEKTAIFDKNSSDDIFSSIRKPLPAAGTPAVGTPLPLAGGAAAQRSSMSTLPPPVPPGATRPHGSLAPPPPVPGSRPLSSSPPQSPHAATTMSLRTPPLPSTTSVNQRALMTPLPGATMRAAPNKFALLAAAVLVLGALALLVVLMLPKQGSMVVAVSGPGNKAIDSVQVLLDGKKQCDTSPCVASGIKAGPHIVKVTAPGYTPGQQAVKIVSGDEAVLNIQLSQASEGTGIKVTAEGSGLRLWIDDREIGALPQEVKDLTPGEHRIRVDGNDRFASYEEKVTLAADQIKTIGPLELKVVRGLAMIEPGENSEGAKVLLVNGSEKRQIPKLPYRVEISTDKGYQLVATKKGYSTATIPVTFEAGKDQKRFIIDLSPGGAEAADDAARPTGPTARAATAPARSSARGAAAVAVAPAPAAPAASKPAPVAAAAAGQGTLNINSIPQSNVLLDGRPLGKTPRAGVAAAAGTHTVVFIHPEHGRKQVSVNVAAGKTATAAVRFP